MKKYYLLIAFVLAFFIQTTQAQEARTITGTITDPETNEPLVGVNVVVKGSTIGTVTNVDGKYTIKLPAGASFVEVRYVGYETKVLPVDEASNVLDVALAEDVLNLGEVVVTALNIKQEKKKLGYTVQQVGGDDLNQAAQTNVMSALSGKVSGVQVSGSSGAIGSSPRVVLRGAASLLGNNQPLYVIDGVPLNNSNFTSSSDDRRTATVDYGSAINDLNPNDIASVNVLKGAAAAALYGERAANGVVMITTKSGSGLGAGKKGIGVSFNSSFSVESPLKLPDYQNEYGQGYDGEFTVNSDESWGPKMDGRTVVDWTGEEVEFVPQPDNVKDFYERGTTLNNSIAFGNQNERIKYRIGFSDLRQKGIIPNSSYQRNVLSANTEAKLTNSFKVGAGLTFSRAGGMNRPAQGQSNESIPFQFIWYPRSINTSALTDYENEDGTPRTWNENFFWENPYWILNKNTNEDTRDRLIANMTLSYDVTSWLNVFWRGSTDWYSDRRQQVYAFNSLNNPIGGFYKDRYFVQELNSDFMVRINKDLTPDLNASLLVGHNVRQNTLDRLYTNVTGLNVPDIYSLDNASGNTSTSTVSMRRFIGLYGDFQLNYKGFANLAFTGRNDWTSTLPKDNNSYFYPSVSGSLIFTDAFNIKNDVLAYGKLRGSWAKVGAATGAYELATTLTRTQVFDPFFDGIEFPFNGTPGFEVSNLIRNPNLQPEFTTSWEIGTDLRFFRNRVGLDITYYNSLSTDLITDADIAPSTGSQAATVNAGEMRNQGIELILNATPVKKKDFQWNFMVNFTKNKSEVLGLTEGLNTLILPGGFSSTTINATPGNPYASIYGRPWLRDDDGKIVVNADGLPILDQTVGFIASSQPDFLVGFNNSFSYKGFDFSFLFDAKKGGKLYSVTIDLLKYAGQGEETLEGREEDIIVDGVTESGEQNTTPVDGISYWKNGIFRATERGLVDASFIKLRELRFGYTVPKNMLSRTPFSNANIALVGRNLWLGAKAPHIDPEVNLEGNGSNHQAYEYAQVPSTRSVGVNLTLDF